MMCFTVHILGLVLRRAFIRATLMLPHCPAYTVSLQCYSLLRLSLYFGQINDDDDDDDVICGL